MDLICPNSLAVTLDNLNQVFFTKTTLSEADRRAAAKWLAARQGLPGSYCGMYAPFDRDNAQPLRLFTGEIINSRAATRHILGEETSRAILLLKVNEDDVQKAWDSANTNMLERLNQYEKGERVADLYCCGNCSTAYWRNISAGGLNRQEERLAAGLQTLRTLRRGNGEWGRFPFYHTLLALLEIEQQAALEEMRYAAPLLEKRIKRQKSNTVYNRRQQILAERVLSKI